MRDLLLICGVVFSGLFVGCASPEQPPSKVDELRVDAAGSQLPPERQIVVKNWPGISYAKVVAYRFEYHRLAGFDCSILDDGVFDSKLLRSHTKKSAILNPSQVERLKDACHRKVLEGNTVSGCYEPHHIFVFYSQTGRPVALAEVCLTCQMGTAIPTTGADFRWDYDALTALIKELGLELESQHEITIDLVVANSANLRASLQSLE